MKLITDDNSGDRQSIYGDAGSFFERHPLSSPTFSLSDRPALSETGSITDLNEVYNNYIASITNPANFKHKEIQNSFDSYVKSAAKFMGEPEFVSGGGHCTVTREDNDHLLGKRADADEASQSCGTKDTVDNPKSLIRRYKFNCLTTISESEQRQAQGELNPDSYSYYIVLNKIWTSEYVKKRDVKALQPCKILLLRSMVKRKFDEELSLMCPNQRRQRHQEPPERPALQNDRKAHGRVQQVSFEAVFQKSAEEIRRRAGISARSSRTFFHGGF